MSLCKAHLYVSSQPTDVDQRVSVHVQNPGWTWRGPHYCREGLQVRLQLVDPQRSSGPEPGSIRTIRTIRASSWRTHQDNVLLAWWVYRVALILVHLLLVMSTPGKSSLVLPEPRSHSRDTDPARVSTARKST